MSHADMTPEEARQYSQEKRRLKRQRRLELGIEEPTRQEVFVKIVERLKERGLTSQEIYETLHSFGRAFSSDGFSWPQMEAIIGGDLTPPDFKLFFKKAK